MMRKIIWGIFIVALAAAYGYNRYRTAHAPLEWSGSVEARTIDVGSRVGGRVLEVLVREGDTVKAGQAIITLEPGDLPAQRLQAQGQLDQAEAALEKVANRALPNARRAEITAAQARLQAEQIALEKAQRDSERMERLFAASAATQVDKDNAAIALRNATAQVAALRAMLDQLLQGTPQDVKIAQGQCDVAKGRLQQLDVMLGELTVRSPKEARVESLDLRPGDMVGAMATAARLMEADQLLVRIYVPETRIGRIKPEQKVPVYVDSFPDRAFAGTVEFISSIGEFTPRNLQTADERADQVFLTRVRLDEGRDTLRAGMAAFVRIDP